MQLPPYVDGSLLDENEADSFPNLIRQEFFKRRDSACIKNFFFRISRKENCNKTVSGRNKELLIINTECIHTLENLFDSVFMKEKSKWKTYV